MFWFYKESRLSIMTAGNITTENKLSFYFWNMDVKQKERLSTYVQTSHLTSILRVNVRY